MPFSLKYLVLASRNFAGTKSFKTEKLLNDDNQALASRTSPPIGNLPMIESDYDYDYDEPEDLEDGTSYGTEEGTNVVIANAEVVEKMAKAKFAVSTAALGYRSSMGKYLVSYN